MGSTRILLVALALRPVDHHGHLLEPRAEARQLEEQLGLAGEAGLADERVAVAGVALTQDRCAVDAVEGGHRARVDAARAAHRVRGGARQDAPHAAHVRETAARCVRGGEHHVRAVAGQVEHAAQRVEVAGGVGLQRDHEAVLGGHLERAPEAAVEGASRTLVRAEADDLHRQQAGMRAGHGRRGVARAVVHHDHPSAGPQLGPGLEVGEQARQVGLLVVCGHHEDVHG